MERIERGLNILKRAWKIYVNPPKESLVFLSPEKITEIFERNSEVSTSLEPKQVAISDNNLAFVSCMKGRSLDVFDLKDNLKLVKKIPFEDQCVEVTVDGDLVFATSTNFARPPQQCRNFLHIFDTKKLDLISSIPTEGNWSKVITIHPSKKYAFVSNWHSHNISVINIEDVKNPTLTQVLAPEKGREQLESPRGIVFTSDGSLGLVTGFYSSNILEISQNPEGQFYFNYISPKLTEGDYGGNPRDIVMHLDDKVAFYSNLGMNTINKWSVKDRKVIDTVKVGKEPNSIALMGQNAEILLVSCRASKSVYVVDTKTFRVIGRSQQTGDTPTGLAVKGDTVLVSDFDSAKLGLYKPKLNS